MKKDNIKWWLFSALLICMLVLAMPFLFLYTPLDLIRFKSSRLYRDMKKNGKTLKYTWLSGLSREIILYELFYKNGISVNVMLRGDSDTLELRCLYFYTEKTLFWLDEAPHYDEQNGRWYLVNEEDPADLVLHSTTKKVVFEENTGHKCERLIYLVRDRAYTKEERAQLKKEPRIAVYNKKTFASVMRELGEIIE